MQNRFSIYLRKRSYWHARLVPTDQTHQSKPAAPSSARHSSNQNKKPVLSPACNSKRRNEPKMRKTRKTLHKHTPNTPKHFQHVQKQEIVSHETSKIENWTKNAYVSRGTIFLHTPVSRETKTSKNPLFSRVFEGFALLKNNFNPFSVLFMAEKI